MTSRIFEVGGIFEVGEFLNPNSNPNSNFM